MVLVLTPGCGTGTASVNVDAPTPPIIKTKTGVEMVLIPAGTFEMGSLGHPGETPHTVTLAAFYMDRTEVTQGQFTNLSLSSPAMHKGENNPVEQVSLFIAKTYCNERSKAEGLKPCYDDDFNCDFAANGYRLPTEAEWEYACRAGSDKDYSFGADARKLGDYAWYKDNSGAKTHPVAQKKPNAWGLYDMHGNVAEWCNDYFDADYYKSSPANNPRGPAKGTQLVLRGGAWESGEQDLRSGRRVGMAPGFQDACFKLDAVGFRCVRKQ
jgi:formylglycine-generating enzyme required for sulfatase activity